MEKEKKKKSGKGKKVLLVILAVFVLAVIISGLRGWLRNNRPDMATADSGRILRWYNSVVTEKYGQYGPKTSSGVSGIDYYYELDDMLSELHAAGRDDIVMEIASREDKRIYGRNRSYTGQFIDGLLAAYSGDRETLISDLKAVGLESLSCSFDESGLAIVNDMLRKSCGTIPEGKSRLDLMDSPAIIYGYDTSNGINGPDADKAVITTDSCIAIGLTPLLPEELQAHSLDEIRYLINCKTDKEYMGSYIQTVGAPESVGFGYRYFSEIRLVDLTKADSPDDSRLPSFIDEHGELLGTVYGTDPPNTSTGGGNQYGEKPDSSKILEYIDSAIEIIQK